MKFGIIAPDREVFELKDFENLKAAEHYAGLKPHEVDHGSISPELGLVVGEYSLFEEKMFFFSINNRIYAGSAVIYQSTEYGDTTDLTEQRKDRIQRLLKFYKDSRDVEKAIVEGKLVRPALSINGQVYWQWPNKKPDWMK